MGQPVKRTTTVTVDLGKLKVSWQFGQAELEGVDRSNQQLLALGRNLNPIAKV